MSSNYYELVQFWAKSLTIYQVQEAENLINWLLEHHLGINRVDRINFIAPNQLPKALLEDFEKLKTGKPIQYILGKGPFYGREFLVSQHTLIPRNETEELVHLILQANSQPRLKILDVGTGTGCIAITLDLEMNDPEVYGLDISENALEVARKNGHLLHSNVNFMLGDIFQEIPKMPVLDILVSNPPYVPVGEKAQIHRNVLDFEPEIALFVSDEDPLIFYRVIGQKGKKLLKSGGQLYFEIHARFGSEVATILQNLGYKEVKIHKDLNGKERMISART